MQEKYHIIQEKFREYLQLHHRSSRTIYDRIQYLKHFSQYMQILGLEDPVQLQSNHLKEYRRYIISAVNKRGTKDTPRTINTRIQAVRLYVTFLYEEDYIICDLKEDVPYIKEPKSLPQVVLTNREVKKILQACNTNTIIGYRNRTILEILYSTGIRRNELRNLKVENIDYQNGYLRVNHGKGDKDRVVPLGKIACYYVENYITGVRKLQIPTGQDPGWLFLTKSGRKIDETAVRDTVIGAVKKSGIKKHVTAHTFRRTCATEMIKNNANLMHVKDILGHEDISSTQVYAKLTIVDLKKAHAKYHPREKDRR